MENILKVLSDTVFLNYQVSRENQGYCYEVLELLSKGSLDEANVLLDDKTSLSKEQELHPKLMPASHVGYTDNLFIILIQMIVEVMRGDFNLALATVSCYDLVQKSEFSPRGRIDDIPSELSCMASLVEVKALMGRDGRLDIAKCLNLLYLANEFLNGVPEVGYKKWLKHEVDCTTSELDGLYGINSPKSHEYVVSPMRRCLLKIESSTYIYSPVEKIRLVMSRLHKSCRVKSRRDQPELMETVISLINELDLSPQSDNSSWLVYTIPLMLRQCTDIANGFLENGGGDADSNNDTWLNLKNSIEALRSKIKAPRGYDIPSKNKQQVISAA